MIARGAIPPRKSTHRVDVHCFLRRVFDVNQMVVWLWNVVLESLVILESMCSLPRGKCYASAILYKTSVQTIADCVAAAQEDKTPSPICISERRS